eukprot:TRINITY_DN21160_c1_g1_i1.p1 TRINITY_DN21160_c1_g1~~TRINITY_DN21160_c1_g1_i1.p1  ORF type:complete len:181 (+),score=12.63 TRINITY_DN21160_c1_g1_i1:84-626(+)
MSLGILSQRSTTKLVHLDTLHIFSLQRIESPVSCSICRSIVWNLSKECFRCRAVGCDLWACDKCKQDPPSNCPATAQQLASTFNTKNRTNTIVENHSSDHVFITSKLSKPALCTVCGRVIISRVGLKCVNCSSLIHKGCRSLDSNPTCQFHVSDNTIDSPLFAITHKFQELGFSDIIIIA